MHGLFGQLIDTGERLRQTDNAAIEPK